MSTGVFRSVFYLALVFAAVAGTASPARSVEYTGGSFRDPFGLDTTESTLSDPQIKREIASLKLNGVVWQGAARPYAIINEKLFGIGDPVGDFNIVDIQKNAVILSYKDAQFTLNKSRKDEYEKK